MDTTSQPHGAHGDPTLVAQHTIQPKAEIDALLTAACERKLDGILCGPALLSPMSFHFERFDAHGLTARIDGEHRKQFVAGSICVLYFAFEGRQASFETHVLETLGDDASFFLLLVSPNQLTLKQSRKHPRLTIPDTLAVVSKIEVDGAVFGGLAVDLGRGGACVHLTHGDDFPFAVGQECRLITEFSGFKSTLSGQMRWRRQSDIGLCFELNGLQQLEPEVRSFDAIFEAVSAAVSNEQAKLAS